MEALIWIDWVIIALITISTLISLKRGFVKEALSLVTWVAAFILARTFHPQMQALLESTVETPLVRLIAAFAILFFGTLIVGAIINNMIGHLVRATGLSATDRVLGMGFGLLRGLVVVIVAIAFIRYTPLAQDTWWRTSVMIDRLGVVEDWSRRTFGDEFARFLEPESQKAVEPTSASS
ncbi:MAG: CvpA family protein [Marinobacter sp.]|uniref:CvpA family protein n=1 Tax=Marinobacter sp. TaxID=50741 RepID=UPI001B65B4C8|nr:CvpA family protein [Marinobacter sp.]MBQ0746766.1 CvpA family protein [Marinobacter sp.]MBQ0814893.1 CvpA family protein [Marinobacter sp.]|tara:strand:+ start:352 stop:888 length:537 start_codon:yes stop_codon:yes gene_type:complete